MSRTIATVSVITAGLVVAILLEASPHFSALTYNQAGGEIVSSSSFVEPILPISDVDWHSLEGSAVYFLLTHGVIQGYPDGTFRGEELVSRAELAKILIGAGNIPLTAIRNNGRFHDVPEAEWYTPFVMTAATRGIVEGYPTQRILFKPSSFVNTAEFLKMLTQTFHLRIRLPQSYNDVPEGIWYEPFAGVAWQYELLPLRPATLLQPNRLLTRREVAIAINLLFHQPKRRRSPQWLPPSLPRLPFVPLPQPAPARSALPLPPSTSSSQTWEENSPFAEEIMDSQDTIGPFGGDTAGTINELPPTEIPQE